MLTIYLYKNAFYFQTEFSLDKCDMTTISFGLCIFDYRRMLEDLNRNFCRLTHATLQSVKYLFPCPSNTIVHRRKIFPWNMIYYIDL